MTARYPGSARRATRKPRKSTTQNVFPCTGASTLASSSRPRSAPRIVENPQFGDLLRSRRVAAGLTQEALAERAGLSLRGVSDLERGLRMAPHRDTLQRLLDALRLDMRDREVLQHAARRRRDAASAPRSREGTASMALPVPLSSFLGRAREMAEVQRRL